MSNNTTSTSPTVPASAVLIRSFTPGKCMDAIENSNTEQNVASSVMKNESIPSSIREKSTSAHTVPFSSCLLRPLTATPRLDPVSCSPDAKQCESSELFTPSSTMDASALASDYRMHRQEMRPSHRRPDSFVSVRIRSDALLSKLTSVQTELVEADPSAAPALISPATFHITLLLLYTGDVQENVESAKCILKQGVEQFRSESDGILSLTFQGLGHFSNKVLFASVLNNKSFETLNHFSRSLTNRFKKKYIYGSDEKSEFRAHLTLAKTSKTMNKSRKSRLKQFRRPEFIEYLLSKHSKSILGEERVECVELLSMNKKMDSDGYYHCYDRFNL